MMRIFIMSSRWRCSASVACWAAVLTPTTFHARPLDGQPNSSGIRRIGFVATHEGTYRLGVQQAYAVAKPSQFARPMVSTATSFDGNEAGLAIGKVFDDLGSLDLHVHDLARVHVHRVQLKDLLGDVQTDDQLAVHGADDLSRIHA